MRTALGWLWNLLARVLEINVGERSKKSRKANTTYPCELHEGGH
jgi:hypothetical protein